MADQFFNKIAEDVLMAAEQIQSLFNTGELSADNGGENDGDGNIGGERNEFPNDITEDLDLEGLSEEEIQELLAEEMMKNNPLQGIADDVTKNIMAGQASPQTITEHFDAFRSAITWSEKFIVGLICFHIFVLLLCLFVSRKGRGLTPRVCVLVFIGIMVRSAEWINKQGAKHWEQFATQDYFDKRGIFIGIMLAAPLLIDSLMMLLFFMSEASSLLIEVKRNELKGKNKKASAKSTKQD